MSNMEKNYIENTLSLLADLSDDDWKYYYSENEVSGIAKAAIKIISSLRESDNSIVKCKDCKYVCMEEATEMMPDMPFYAVCTLTDEAHEPDWFCADGEKRTD